MIEYSSKLEALILDIVLRNPRNFVRVLKSRRNTHLVDYIYRCTPLLDDKIHTFKTRLYWTLNHLQDFPLCLNDKNGIHKMTTTNVKKLKDGYPKFCNSRCQHEAPAYYQIIRDKIKQKYGVDNVFQLDSVKSELALRKDEIQTKRDKTRHEHFGDDPGWNLKKSLETRKAKYSSAFNQEAVRKTKKALHDDPNWNNPEKNFLTKKRNGTLNTSKSEDISYDLLKLRFGKDQVVRQFKSDLYPFACDFYIKHLDIYIECNYSWVHGSHRFDSSSEEDRSRVSLLKSKRTKYYDNAVDTWTRRDILKVETALMNCLNYFVFYSLEDLEVWLECSVF